MSKRMRAAIDEAMEDLEALEVQSLREKAVAAAMELLDFYETHPKRAAEVGPLIAELKRCIEALEAEGRGTCGS